MNSYNNTVIVIFKLKYWRKCIDVLYQVFKAKMTKKLNKISTLFCNNFIFQKYKVLKSLILFNEKPLPSWIVTITKVECILSVLPTSHFEFPVTVFGIVTQIQTPELFLTVPSSSLPPSNQLPNCSKCLSCQIFISISQGWEK